MRPLIIFWGIVAPILFFLYAGLKIGIAKENEYEAFMYKCRRQHATPTQLADLSTDVRITQMCRGIRASQR